jgi:hypothetical protein
MNFSLYFALASLKATIIDYEERSLLSTTERSLENPGFWLFLLICDHSTLYGLRSKFIEKFLLDKQTAFAAAMCHYAKYTIKGRWIEAEPHIASSTTVHSMYINAMKELGISL